MDNDTKLYIKYKGIPCLFIPENVNEINNDKCEYIKGQVLHIENGCYHPSQWYRDVLIHNTNINHKKDLDTLNNESDSESDSESDIEPDKLTTLNMIHSFKYRDNYNNLIYILYIEFFAILFIFITLYNIDVNILF